MPDGTNTRKKILTEARSSKLNIHPGSNKMYNDLQSLYWWPKMKQDIACFVAECDMCRHVKAHHLKHAGLLQPLPIPTWKLEDISTDFIVDFPRATKGYDSISVIVDYLTKSTHFLHVKTI